MRSMLNICKKYKNVICLIRNYIIIEDALKHIDIKLNIHLFDDSRFIKRLGNNNFHGMHYSSFITSNVMDIVFILNKCMHKVLSG